ncbi:MAG: DNA repair protein RecO [Halanaerobiaceae bacterium]
MSIFETETIVLKQFDLGESDKIITFYTKDYGKIRAVARGVRKSKSSISGVVLPFTYNYTTFYQGRSLDRINKIKNIFSFVKLREDLTKTAYASFMAELIEKVGLEGESNQALFSLLLSSFHQMINSNDEDIKKIEISFKLRIIGIMGFKPELSNCIYCDKELIHTGRNIFDIEQGGLVCSECSNQISQSAYRFVITGESIKIMMKILSSGLKPLERLKISKNSYNQLDELTNKFIMYHLDLNLKSLVFLNMIKKMG